MRSVVGVLPTRCRRTRCRTWRGPGARPRTHRIAGPTAGRTHCRTLQPPGCPAHTQRNAQCLLPFVSLTPCSAVHRSISAAKAATGARAGAAVAPGVAPRLAAHPLQKPASTSLSAPHAAQCPMLPSCTSGTLEQLTNNKRATGSSQTVAAARHPGRRSLRREHRCVLRRRSSQGTARRSSRARRGRVARGSDPLHGKVASIRCARSMFDGLPDPRQVAKSHQARRWAVPA